MTRKSHKYYISLLILLHACIEEYTPEIKSIDIDEYVVTGQLTDQEGFHTINISRSSSLSNPQVDPVRNCTVEIQDDKGNSFFFSEKDDEGNYKIWIDKEFLTVGTSYKLIVTTPDNEILESDYCEMPSCPSLDSIYYFIEVPKRKATPYDITEGIRFYLDFSGNENDSKFLRWKLTETWEYHTFHRLYVTINRSGRHYADPSDRSRSVCWKTETIKDYFLNSTMHFSQNDYKKLALHYVDNHTQRLNYAYFLRVDQLAINEDAFFYWTQVKENSNQEGGLYEKQPVMIPGNITNTSNPDKKVLGFFEVASVNTKNIFVKDLVIRMDFHDCSLWYPDIGRPFPPTARSPIYITWHEGVMWWMHRSCWDCIARGGKNVKPEFWPY